MKKSMFIASGVAIALHAQVFELGQIEVTATQSGSRESDTNVAVIDSDLLEKNEIKNVSEAANIVPGVFVEKRGGRAEQNINIRGFNSRRVPVFIDGIPVYIPYDGNMDLSRFTTFDFSKIDISKGSSSVLYGANTMGGAINLVTKKPQKEFEGDIAYGMKSGRSNDTFGNDIHFNLGSKQELFYVQTGASFMENRGIELSKDYKQSKASDEDGDRLDNSAKRDKKFSIKFGLTPNETDEYAIAYSMQRAQKEQPFYAGKYKDATHKYWDWPKWDKDSVYFLSHTQLQNSLYFNTKLFYDTFKNDLSSYDDKNLKTQNKKSSFNSHYKDYSYGMGIEVGGNVSDNDTLKFATSYKFDQHKENDDDEPIQKMQDKTYSFGLENTYKFTDLTRLIIGASYDTRDAIKAQDYQNKKMFDFDVGKKHAFNYQAAIKHSFDENDELSLSYAKKTYFPSMKERYTRSIKKNKTPNPFLDPEKANHYEIGYGRTFADTLRVESAVFYSTVKDAIAEVKLKDGNFQNQNVGKAQYKGFEFGTSWYATDNLEFGGNYTYINAKYKNSDEKIYDIPKHKAYAFLDYKIMPKFSIYLSQYLTSSRYSNVGGKKVVYTKLGGFGVSNLKLTYEVVNNLSVDVGVSNLFDKNYEYSEGYPEEGRVFFSNIRYKF